MDTNTNKQTVRRVFEDGFTAGRLDVIDECLAPGRRRPPRVHRRGG